MGWNYLSIPKFQLLHPWSLGVDNSFHHTFYWACDYSSMVGLKLIHVNERDPRCIIFNYIEAQTKWVPFCRYFSIVFHWMKSFVFWFKFHNTTPHHTMCTSLQNPVTLQHNTSGMWLRHTILNEYIDIHTANTSGVITYNTLSRFFFITLKLTTWIIFIHWQSFFELV